MRPHQAEMVLLVAFESRQIEVSMTLRLGARLDFSRPERLIKLVKAQVEEFLKPAS